MSLVNRGLEIEIDSFINPQSAIRNPQSASPLPTERTMLTEEERREIETELHQYAQKRAVCIDALKIVQRRRGWVSDESVRDLAEFLEMTPDELDSVATFYNLIFRKPVGRRVILICDSVSCWIMGYDRIREHLTARLGIGLRRDQRGWRVHDASHPVSRRLRSRAGADDRRDALSGFGAAEA